MGWSGQAVIAVDPLSLYARAEQGIAFGDVVLLIGGASAYPTSPRAYGAPPEPGERGSVGRPTEAPLVLRGKWTGSSRPRLHDMAASIGYLLAGTPRTGSTYLCSLLASTGVLGRPESYFREPDETTWAERFGLPTVGQRVHNYRSFVNAVRLAATTENGVFGARIMWGTVERIMHGLEAPPHQSNLAALQGPLDR